MNFLNSVRQNLAASLNYDNYLTHDLVACYPFSEGSGNVAYDLVSQRNLILYNGPTWTNSFGGGLTFDGSNDYGENTRLFASFTSLSFSIWVYKTVAFEATYKKILVIGDAGGNISIYLSQGPGSDRIYFGVGTTTGQTSATINSGLLANTWYHLVGTWNGSVVKLYINGKFQAQGNNTGTWPGGYRNYPLRVGYGYGGEYFNGTVRDLLIYNRSLDADEVLRLYIDPNQIYKNSSTFFSFSVNRFLGAPSISSSESFGNHYLRGPITFYPNSIQAPEVSSNLNIQNKGVVKYSNKKSRVFDYDFRTETNFASYKDLEKPNLNYYIIGTSSNSTYGYRISSLNQYGETDTNYILINNGPNTLSNSDFIRLTWQPVKNASGYKIYGRTFGNERYLATVTNTNYFDDFGSITPTTNYLSKNQTGYNPNKLNLGPMMRKYTGPKNYDNYVGVLKLSTIPVSNYTSNWPYIIKVFEYGDNYNYILTKYGGAGQYRFLHLFKHFPDEERFIYAGRLNLTLTPSASNSDYGNYAQLYNHTNGTVSVSGTSVTGSNTFWIDERIAVGARIGFGSTAGKLITNWYEITAINSNTSITINKTAGTINLNTPYIIEELRIISFNRQTISPFNQAGVFVTKGLHFDVFQIQDNVTIPMATTIDNIRASYRLYHPSLNPNDGGGPLDYEWTPTEHYLYYLNNTALRNFRIYKYNLRAALTTLVNGESTNAVLFYTRIEYIYGSYSNFLSIIHSPKHGKYKDKKIMVFQCNSGVSYIIEISRIKENSSDWIVDRMAFQRAHGNQQAIIESTQFYRTIQYDSYSDTYFLGESTHNTISKMEGITSFGLADFDLKSGKMPYHYSRLYRYPLHYDGDYTWQIWPNETSDGIFYVLKFYANRGVSLLCLPLFSDMIFAEKFKNRLVLPKFTFKNVARFNKIIVQNNLFLYDEKFGLRPEAYKMYYRINGIDDDSGKWTEVNNLGNISSIPPIDELQLMFEFKIIKKTAITARLYSLSIMYDTYENLPKELTFSFSDTNLNSNIIGFKQKYLFDSLVYFVFECYDKEKDYLIFTQNSFETTYGYFQYFTNQWVNGIGPNIIGTRRRFVITTSLPTSSINVKIYKGL